MILLEKEKKQLEILLVEDNPADVKLASVALMGLSQPYHLNVVDNGAKAMDFLARQGDYAAVPRPDLIFLDWNLPLKNGKEVLVEIRKDPNLNRIPVVVLSISGLETNVSDAYSLGAKFYVTKPMGLDRFAVVMGSVIKILNNQQNLSPN